MKTVLVKYQVSTRALHPMLEDDGWIESQIVEVERLTDLNTMFKRIVDAKVLE